jgi:hypothetical protein
VDATILRDMKNHVLALGKPSVTVGMEFFGLP